jgi:hypothetical protein
MNGAPHCELDIGTQLTCFQNLIPPARPKKRRRESILGWQPALALLRSQHQDRNSVCISCANAGNVLHASA